MNILNQNESFRSLKNLNLNKIKSVLVKNCIELEQNIEEIFDVKIDSHSLYFYGKKNKS